MQRAVDEELAASKADHSLWRYRDDHKDIGSVYIVVQTSQGSVKELIERDGKSLSAADSQAERQRIENFIHSPSQIRKQQRDDAQDDKSAQDLLRLLPRAFRWKIVNETDDLTTLHFDPDPDFDAPDIKSRVLGTMSGEMVIDRKAHRIRTIKGELTDDVSIGWGILGKLRKGGTFDVERREIAPGIWQIVETHVHINGRALFFKSIGQQQDEISSNFTSVPLSTTFEEAVKLLNSSPDEQAETRER
ncbi:hypothetical protein GCM10011507_26570 [Edaphobacter acidisoli]|uniref:Uncharacterized protein n=1 Tax=Edaphobacter acidisoli TaxID=2040573 RepID=A0A916W7H3_9BACT|nr:hypothetical protein [Edaphobacter acidisoli]GGA73911.1 hypothetical protein GCM10011507_26570 [Edaphobacter acidisoli]